ncbi:MPPV-234 N1R/p28-like protein [Magpiepox virus 2]|nr:MPPV-234 N1R/p28-like protein [Magpiepox virus 2]
MLKENNYINFTKLYKLGGKDFHLWKHLDGSKELNEEMKRNKKKN